VGLAFEKNSSERIHAGLFSTQYPIQRKPVLVKRGTAQAGRKKEITEISGEKTQHSGATFEVTSGTTETALENRSGTDQEKRKKKKKVHKGRS